MVSKSTNSALVFSMSPFAAAKASSSSVEGLAILRKPDLNKVRNHSSGVSTRLPPKEEAPALSKVELEKLRSLMESFSKPYGT
ncbi:hypothetical protein CR513_26520, partial [Mucuna pruriens]